MSLFATLRAGGSLALLRRPRPERLTLTPGQFWALAALGMGVSFCASFASVEPPRVLVPDALQTEGFSIALTLLLGFVLARLLASPSLSWQLPVLLASAGLFVTAAGRLVYDGLLPALGAEWEIYRYYYYLSWLWWALVIQRALTALAPAQAAVKRGLLAAGATVLSVAPAHYLNYQTFWQVDYQARYAQEIARGERAPPLTLAAEEILYRQPELLAQALEGVAGGQPGTPELYFVAFGGYGAQNVFMNEVLYTQRLFQERFGAAGRTVALVNNPRLVDTFPLASVTNLRAVLRAVAARMNPEDILFLFLTSHGSREHGLSVELDSLPLQELTAARLAELLKEAGLPWKVIVVSACYSGGFIEPLKDDHSLIITASRADRNSFGCSDSADFTYFGRAFFTQALAQTTSFTEAFAKAKALIEEWEQADGYTHSEPQLVSSPLIEKQLARWRAALERSEVASGCRPDASGGPC